MGEVTDRRVSTIVNGQRWVDILKIMAIVLGLVGGGALSAATANVLGFQTEAKAEQEHREIEEDAKERRKEIKAEIKEDLQQMQRYLERMENRLIDAIKIR